MTVVQLREPPAILEEWLERRRALGQDGYDEVWNGVYHVAPMARGQQGALQDELAGVLRGPARAAGLRGSGPVNIGDSNDYRVPDHVWFRTRQRLVWFPTAAILAEIVSPADESREKLGFYFDHGSTRCSSSTRTSARSSGTYGAMAASSQPGRVPSSA